MSQRRTPRVLLVEGSDEFRVVPELLEQNGVDWGRRGEEIVRIEPADGVTNLLKPTFISGWAKASSLEALGLIVDADEDGIARWQQVRSSSLKTFEELPDQLPEEGLVHERADGLRFGVYLFPDNRSRGMLETFMTFLVRDEHEPLLTFADECVSDATEHGAPYRSPHRDKARIHTWLAWQEPPGRQLHEAIKFSLLDPRSPHAAPFVAWFRRLFRV